jgi:hypothetical protein
MKDVEGLLISIKKRCRLVLSVTILQRSVSVKCGDRPGRDYAIGCAASI